MSQNKNALIRYKTIDKCLQNLYRKWTLDALVEACSDALYEYEGKDSMVSKRTIQLDLQLMRSDKLGYNAPIICYDKKYYKYEDPSYSITNIPLTKQDLDKLSEAVEFLKQFNGFSHFKDLAGMVQKLDDQILSVRNNKSPIIDFETNDNLKGIEYLDVIYQAIFNKKVLLMEYKSFKALSVDCFLFHPHLLKEYNNRWFVLGHKEQQPKIFILALDRIESLSIKDQAKYIRPKDFDPQSYFKDIIGVTIMEGQRAEAIRLKVNKENAPYVETKPFHHSQHIIEKTTEFTIFEIRVKVNYELERLILGFGDGIEIMSPKRLRGRIKKIISKAHLMYNENNDPL